MVVNNEDIVFDDEASQDEVKSGADDISLDLDDEEIETPKEEVNTDEQPKEEETPEQTATAGESDLGGEDEEVDFDKLFAELDDANEAIDKIEVNNSSDNKEEVSVLKQALNNMEQMIKKLTNEKSDLLYKNAELEAFGGDGTDPKVLILSRNLSKAKEGDERSKTKVISTLKDMLYDMTGEDYDNSKINKDIDILTAAESYNTLANPNLKANKVEDDGMAL